MNNRKHAEMKPSSQAWQFPEEGKGLNSEYDHTGRDICCIIWVSFPGLKILTLGINCIYRNSQVNSCWYDLSIMEYSNLNPTSRCEHIN